MTARRRPRALAIGIAAAALCALGAGVAGAGTIDNTAGLGNTSNGDNRTIGGTFLADDVNLASFTMELNWLTNPGALVAAVVYGTDGTSTPTGSLLWSSTPFAAPASRTFFAFTPNVTLVPGLHYYIGITGRPGVVLGTSSNASQQYTVYIQTTTLAAPAQIWRNDTTDAAPTTGNNLQDVRSTIVMNPEPGTWALFGVGVGGLLAVVARRRRRRIAPGTAS